MKQVKLLVMNFLNGVKNSMALMSRKKDLKTLVFPIMGCMVATAIYIFFYWLLSKLNAFEIIGPILMEKLLFIIFLTFLTMLLFSNIITGLSTYYLSNDLPFLLSSPLKIESIFTSKFFNTVIESSWSVIFFGLPVFLAYGIVMKADWYFYPLIPIFLIPFLLIPAGLGISVIMLLVRIYPVKKIKEITILLFIAFFATLVVYMRSLQPERLANPESFSLLTDYLTFLKGPNSPYLPSYWVAAAFLKTIKSSAGETAFYFLVLLSSAAASYLLAKWIAGRVYYNSWTRSQNKISGQPVRFAFLEKILKTNSFSQTLLLRDLRLFWRDVTQWSQIILFLAIGAIYIFNLKSFRLQTHSTTLISYINLGFTGFVIAATSVRFTFPAISLEGKAFWLIKVSPCPMKTVLKEKFWTSFIPMLLLGESLMILSNILLKIDGHIFVMGIALIFLMVLGLTGLAVGIGATHPRFKATNPAEIGGTYGGLTYMAIALAYVVIMMFMLEWPFIVFLLSLAGIRLGSEGGICISAAGTLILTFFAVYIPMKKGLKTLERSEWT